MPYRETGLACPACNAALVRARGKWDLELEHCTACQGIWLGEDTLREMYRQSGQGYELEWLPRLTREPTRACPRCTRPMKPSLIEVVEVERCEHHGIWFDRSELERALNLDPLEPIRYRRTFVEVLREHLPGFFIIG